MPYPRRNPAVPLVSALDALASIRLRTWLRTGKHADLAAQVVEGAISRAAACATAAQETIYDAEGRKYPTVYRFVPAYLDGRTVATSHRAKDLEWAEGYPPEFQTRDLGSPEESIKIQNIATHFDPLRMLGKNLDATLGPPVVWQGEDERLYVLGGNGRTLAFLRAPEEAYERYLELGRCLWADFPAGAAPKGSRWMLVRVVSRLTKGQAAQLAAASQLSTSAEEGRIGKAMGLVRSLDIQLDKLPPFVWTEPIAPDNVDAFAKENPAFVNAILANMDPAKRSRYRVDPESLASVVSAAMIAFLPKEARGAGVFTNRKIEDAFIGALPAILSSQSLARDERIYPEYNLYPHIQEATRVFESFRYLKLPFSKLTARLDEERRTERIPGVIRLSDASDLALSLAAALYNASQRSAPEDAVAGMLREYLDVVQQFNPKAPLLGGFGNTVRRPDPGELLAEFVPRFELPRNAPPPVQGGMFGMGG